MTSEIVTFTVQTVTITITVEKHDGGNAVLYLAPTRCGASELYLATTWRGPSPSPRSSAF